MRLNFDWWRWMVIVAMGMMVLSLLCRCTTTRYVQVPEYHTRYVTRTDTLLRQDSVYVRDSVWVRSSGDTTTIYKYRYRDRWRNVYRTSTDTVIKRDSLTVVNEVEKPLTSRQAALVRLGEVFIGFMALSVLGAIIWLTRRFS